MQTTKNVFLVRPANFYFNNETAHSNAFQNKTAENETDIKQKAFSEFDRFADALKSKGVNVIIFEDTDTPKKPDAIFPNNWISMHADGTMILYPMCAPNRRLERRQDIIDLLKKKFTVNKTIDLSVHENENKFLEGTGSIVFDHNNKMAYACLSERTDKGLFIQLCDSLKYKPIYFFSHDQNKKEIYHTNVMMCVAEKFAVICLNSIGNEQERKQVSDSLSSTEHEIVDISFEQMNHFAGNMLALHNESNKAMLVMSQSAYTYLTSQQKKSIEQYCEIVSLNISTIETIGGGSARCMIAEVFLPIN